MQKVSPEKAYQRAAARCARCECCRHDLRQNLLRAGLDADEAEAVLDRLEQEKFLDAARYVRAFVADKLRYERWGRIKIRQALLQKQLPEAEIELALTDIDEEEYIALLHEVIQKKIRSLGTTDDYTGRQKVARYAISRGFEPDKVFRAINAEGWEEIL